MGRLPKITTREFSKHMLKGTLVELHLATYGPKWPKFATFSICLIALPSGLTVVNLDAYRCHRWNLCRLVYSPPPFAKDKNAGPIKAAFTIGYPNNLNELNMGSIRPIILWKILPIRAALKIFKRSHICNEIFRCDDDLQIFGKLIGGGVLIACCPYYLLKHFPYKSITVRISLADFVSPIISCVNLGPSCHPRWDFNFSLQLNGRPQSTSVSYTYHSSVLALRTFRNSCSALQYDFQYILFGFYQFSYDLFFFAQKFGLSWNWCSPVPLW